MKKLLKNTIQFICYTSFLLLSITIYQGCSLNSLVKEVKKQVPEIPVKVDELKDLYLIQKDMYKNKKITAIKFQKTIFGNNGETDMWIYLLKTEKPLTIKLKKLWEDLKILDKKLIELDKKLIVEYMTWKSYQKTVTDMTNSIKKTDIALNLLNIVINKKLNANNL